MKERIMKEWIIPLMVDGRITYKIYGANAELIRCNDCKFYRRSMNGKKGLCSRQYDSAWIWKEDDFCSKAEREEA